MGMRVSGGAWLGLSVILLMFTAVSTFCIFVAGFAWEPDEYPASYWRDSIPGIRLMMAVAMVIPAAAAGAALASILVRPRGLVKMIGGGLVLAVSLAAFGASWWLGLDAIDTAKYWAVQLSR